MPIGKGFHPAADIFPEMSDAEYMEFRQDVLEHGLMVPIVTTKDGQILDGRHRWRACMDLHLEPKYQVHNGDPWAYVVSANLHRRHLTTSQRAMVADRLRNAAPGGQPGNKNNRYDTTKSARRTTVTRAQAAKMLGVGADSVHQAGVVRKEGVPELASLVDDGKVNVHVAAKVAREFDRTSQLDWVGGVRSGSIDPRAKTDNVIAMPPPKRLRPTDKIKAHRFTKKDAEGLASALSGMQLAFSEILEVEGVPPQEADYLVKEITRTKTVLNRLQALLREVGKSE